MGSETAGKTSKTAGDGETEERSKSGCKTQPGGVTAGKRHGGRGGGGGTGRLRLCRENDHTTVIKLESFSLVQFSIWYVAKFKELKLMHLIM